MNKNILIVLGGAVLVAVLVAMLVQVTLGGKKEAAALQEAKVEVLVASKDRSAQKQREHIQIRLICHAFLVRNRRNSNGYSRTLCQERRRCLKTQ